MVTARDTFHALFAWSRPDGCAGGQGVGTAATPTHRYNA